MQGVAVGEAGKPFGINSTTIEANYFKSFAGTCREWQRQMHHKGLSHALSTRLSCAEEVAVQQWRHGMNRLCEHLTQT